MADERGVGGEGWGSEVRVRAFIRTASKALVSLDFDLCESQVAL